MPISSRDRPTDDSERNLSQGRCLHQPHSRQRDNARWAARVRAIMPYLTEPDEDDEDEDEDEEGEEAEGEGGDEDPDEVEGM